METKEMEVAERVTLILAIKSSYHRMIRWRQKKIKKIRIFLASICNAYNNRSMCNAYRSYHLRQSLLIYTVLYAISCYIYTCLLQDSNLTISWQRTILKYRCLSKTSTLAFIVYYTIHIISIDPFNFIK